MKIAPSGRRGFVIQRHDASRLHYDLRLELARRARPWRITARASASSKPNLPRSRLGPPQLLFRNHAASNTTLAAAVLWVVGIVVAAFVDDQRTALHIGELEPRNRHRLVDPFVCCVKER
jgi:hypothetical protein